MTVFLVSPAIVNKQESIIGALTSVIDLAITVPRMYGLGALDSFQLAAALVWCNEKPRQRSFVCFDTSLAEAAEKAGFLVVT